MIQLVVICGPTCSGKTELGIKLSKVFNGEIISADSRQVYRLMNIGTSKPTEEERGFIPYHLIDVFDPNDDFNVAKYILLANNCINEIFARGKNIFIVGGTGLYIKALTKGIFLGPKEDKGLRMSLKEELEERGGEYLYSKLRDVDPTSAERIHPNDHLRIIRALEVYKTTGKPISVWQDEHGFKKDLYNVLKIGLNIPRRNLYRYIDDRVDKMIPTGLVDEVKGLVKMGFNAHLKSMNGLGYKEIIGYINGDYSIAEAIKIIKRNTRRYAKRQLTWFRRDKDIQWYNPKNDEGIIFQRVKDFLSLS